MHDRTDRPQITDVCSAMRFGTENAYTAADVRKHMRMCAFKHTNGSADETAGAERVFRTTETGKTT